MFITDPRSGETEGEDPGTHPLDMHHNEQSRQQRAAQQSKTRESGDQTLLESPERGKAPAKGNNKNRKKRAA